MKHVITLVLVAALAAVTVDVASAACAATPRIDRREAWQHGRIREGVRSGELTRGEAMRLRAGQAHVRAMEYRAKSDGVVTPGERARITRTQNRQSRHIYRMKHNGLER